MSIILIILGLLAFSALAWWGCEGLWDRRHFLQGPAGLAPRNHRARGAAALLRELPELLVIDLRPEPSWRTEHLPGALSLPFEMGGGGFGPEAQARLDALPRSRPMLVYCDGGFRSRLALPALQAAGFQRIHHLHRGLLSWKLAALPTESEAS